MNFYVFWAIYSVVGAAVCLAVIHVLFRNDDEDLYYGKDDREF